MDDAIKRQIEEINSLRRFANNQANRYDAIADFISRHKLSIDEHESFRRSAQQQRLFAAQHSDSIRALTEGMSLAKRLLLTHSSDELIAMGFEIDALERAL